MLKQAKDLMLRWHAASLILGEGTKSSQLSDIKCQGERVVDFFTEEKVLTRRFSVEGRQVG